VPSFGKMRDIRDEILAAADLRASDAYVKEHAENEMLLAAGRILKAHGYVVYFPHHLRK